MADGSHTIHHVRDQEHSLQKNFDKSKNFYSKEGGTPILLDEAEQARRLAERQKVFKEYRASRQAVLELRNEDRLHRNEAKLKQLEMAEQWQVRLQGKP